MPTIADYLRLAPYNLDELVTAANGVLRGDPRQEISRRTVRFYIDRGVLPPPSGPPKFARYEATHLLRTVAIRLASSRGRSLDEASRAADQLLLADAEEAATRLQAQLNEVVASPAVRSRQASELFETPSSDYGATLSAPAPTSANRAAPIAQSVLRVALDHDIALELPGPELQARDLQRAVTGIERLLDSLQNT